MRSTFAIAALCVAEVSSTEDSNSLLHRLRSRLRPRTSVFTSPAHSRCGISELDAREQCGPPCTNSGDCFVSGGSCWLVNANYCGSIPKRTYINPVQSSGNQRCGKTELDARTFCGEECRSNEDCGVPGEACHGVQPNYCGSSYTEDGSSVAGNYTTNAATSSSGFPDERINSENRCGKSEVDARENCRSTCATNIDCPSGQYCWGVYPNYCGSIPDRIYDHPVQSNVWNRCGKSEIDARTHCGQPCIWSCSNPDETCYRLHPNYCGSTYAEVEV